MVAAGSLRGVFARRRESLFVRGSQDSRLLVGSKRGLDEKLESNGIE